MNPSPLCPPCWRIGASVPGSHLLTYGAEPESRSQPGLSIRRKIARSGQYSSSKASAVESVEPILGSVPG